MVLGGAAAVKNGVNYGSETANPSPACRHTQLKVLQAYALIFMSLLSKKSARAIKKTTSAYLLADGPHHGEGEGPDHSPPQVLSLPLLAELAQLLLLLLAQGAAVVRLEQTQGGEEGEFTKRRILSCLMGI